MNTTPPPSSPEQWAIQATADIRKVIESDSEIAAGFAAQYHFSDEAIQAIILRHASALIAENARLNAALLESITKTEAADGRINELEQSRAGLMVEIERLKTALDAKEQAP